jgi:hypothetical protein
MLNFILAHHVVGEPEKGTVSFEICWAVTFFLYCSLIVFTLYVTR